MNQSLIKAAEAWLEAHADSIEFFEKFLPLERVPDDAEDPEEWARTFGQEDDACVGFRLQPVTSADGGSGIALIIGKGHSWEGLRLSVEGIYETEKEALRSIDEIGVRI